MVANKARVPGGEEQSGSTGWLIAGKLMPPATGPGIARPLLLDRLDAGLERHLSLIVASAGYGKTTLAAHWHNRLRARSVGVAWLTLDDDEADATQFLCYVIHAVAGAGVDVGTLAAAATKGLAEIPARSALAALINAIAAHNSPLVLILDDFHKIVQSPAEQLVRRLIARAPRGLHLLLACREPPTLPTSELKSRNELSRLDALDLRFSVAEAGELLPAFLTPAQAALLAERTEGWPAALQLARIWLEEDAGRLTEIDAFSGRFSDIAAYLAEQIFAGLDPATKSFLLHTCILERFNGDVANAVCGRDDCPRILHELQGLSSFILPIDSAGHWYRFHNLFQDFLYEQLQRTPAIHESSLNARASDWYARNGDLREAVRHAHRAGDVRRAARLVEDAGGWELVFVEGTGVVHNLTRDFTGQDLEDHPRLQLCRVYLLLKQGDPQAAQQTFERVRIRTANFCASDDGDTGRLRRDGTMLGLMLAGYQDHLAHGLDPASLQRILVTLPADDHRGLATVFMCRCLHGLGVGDFETVQYAARQTMRHLRLAGVTAAPAYAHLQLGLAQLFQGLLPKAEASFRTGLHSAEEGFGADSGPKAVADVLLAEVHHQRGELAAAAARLEDSLLRAEDYDGWFDIYASGYQTGIGLACAQREFDQAQRFVKRGEETAISRGLSRLKALMEAAAIRVAVAAGELKRADVLVGAAATPLSPGAWKSNRALWRQCCAMAVAHAEHAIAGSRPAYAVEVLGDADACCVGLGCHYKRVEVLVLRALARQLLGHLEPAAADLGSALALAASQDLLQVFLERGQPLEVLLLESAQAYPDRFADAAVGAFIDRWRRASAGRSGRISDADADALRGSITGRELEVLVQLGRGHSNKSISRTLALSENTVKFHLKNIYGKLRVDGRRGAVEKARACSIIH